MEDLISVIVPVYNVEKYLNKCVDSIINQTYKNLEIILVDDGSPDNCGKICDDYAKKDSRIRVFHKENSGVSSARNLGINNSTGNWIAFIDSDDWIEEKYFEIMLDKAKKENADIVICGYNKIWKNKIEPINTSMGDKVYNSKEYLINCLYPQTGFGFCHMKIIKKDCIGQALFDEKIAVGEDALFNIEISKNIEKVVFLSKPLYNYRNNENSLVKRFDQNYAKKYLQSMKECKEYLFNNYNEDEIIQKYYNFVAFHVMLVAVNYCYHPNNEIKNKRKLLKEICEYDEFKDGIRKSNYDGFSLTRKITLFTLKYKMYLVTELICKIRQSQNKKG